MDILSWAILFIACLGFVLTILAKIPQVLQRGQTKGKGLPPVGLRAIIRSIWHFILEAKDLTPPIHLNQRVGLVGQKVKQIFKIRIRQSKNEPVWLPEASESAQSTEEMFLNAIKKDPNNKQAYEGLGRLYLQEKNWIEAEEIFRFLVNLDPAKDTYHSNLALILYSLKRFRDAAAEYEKAIEINNKVPSRWVNLSLCFLAVDDYPRAIKAIMKAVDMDRRNKNYLSLASDLYIKIGNKVRAEELLSEMLSQDPTNRLAREKLMRLKI